MFTEWQFPSRGTSGLPYDLFSPDIVINTPPLNAPFGVYHKPQLCSGIHTSHHCSHFFRLPNTQHLLTASCSLKARMTEWPELAFPLKPFKWYNLSLFCPYIGTFCWRSPYFWSPVSFVLHEPTKTINGNPNHWEVFLFKSVPFKWVISLSKYTVSFKHLICYTSTKEFTVTLCCVTAFPLFCKTFILGL